MVSITLSVPDETRKLMKKFPEVNWSGLIRQYIMEKTKKLSIKEELLRQFNKEKEFDEWAIDVVRKGRR